jgi:predicted Zn-dependent peptidase
VRDIRITTLGNGLRVATDHVPTVESVSLGIWVGAGTRCEAREVNGVAHLLEHMVFKGTPQRSARDIAEQIEATGGHMNAYTSRESTAYYVKILKDDVALAVDVLADILQHSLIDDEELRRERTVILQEIAQVHDTPDDLIFDNYQAMAFAGQALGRPVLGDAEIVRELPRAAILDYLGGHYLAGAMLLVAAGNVDHDALVALAEAKFGALPAGAREPLETARYTGGESRDERDLEQVHLALGFRGVSLVDDDFHAVSVMSNLFGGGMSSRLFQEIRERRGLAYTIDTFVSCYADDGLFGVYAGTGEQDVAELVPVLCDEIVRLADTVREEEVARARAQLRAGVLMALESTSARCEQVAQHLLVYGRVVPVEEIVARVEAVEVADVARVVRRIFATPPTLAAVGPLGRLEPLAALGRRLVA